MGGLVFVNQSYNVHLFYFESFFQDHLGRMWAGSNVSGPMLYNGQKFKSYRLQGTLFLRFPGSQGN